MWKYKIAFVKSESKLKAIELLSNLCAKVYSDAHYVIVECHDHMWNEILNILDSIKGYSLFREYYD